MRRVSLKSILIAVAATVVVYWLISRLLGVDCSALFSELSTSNWWWMAAALLLSPMVQAMDAIGTMGASIKPLRYGPAAILQYAIQFIALIALTALPGLTAPLRGTSTSTALAASGPSVLQEVLILIAAIALAAALTWLIPSARRRATSVIPKARATIDAQRASAQEALQVLRRPTKLTQILAGNLGSQIIQAVILGACLHAFGADAHLSQLVLVNTLVVLFAGLMPVPGGVEVAETGYVAGLKAIGIPSAVAISTALAFRPRHVLPPATVGVSSDEVAAHPPIRLSQHQSQPR